MYHIDDTLGPPRPSVHPSDDQATINRSLFTDRGACKVCYKVGKFFSGGCCSTECFSVNFWMEKVVWQMRGDVVLDERTHEVTDSWAIRPARYGDLRSTRLHFVCVPDRLYSGAGFHGFGGAMWYFKMVAGPHVGRIIRSNNVWCQGDIPLEFTALLPINAKVLTKEEYDAQTAANSGS